MSEFAYSFLHDIKCNSCVLCLHTEKERIAHTISDKFTVGTVLCCSHMTVIWLPFLMTDGSPEMASRRWQVTPSTAQRCADCESQAETQLQTGDLPKKRKKAHVFNSSLLRPLSGFSEATNSLLTSVPTPLWVPVSWWYCKHDI